jgi:hypothetical protein
MCVIMVRFIDGSVQEQRYGVGFESRLRALQANGINASS